MFATIFNLILFGMGIVSFYSGITFYIRERNNLNTAAHILAISFANGLGCIGYSVMSVCTNVNAAFLFRDIGLLGVDLYMIMEAFIFLSFISRNERVILCGHFVGFAILLTDMIIFGHPNAKYFVLRNTYTTYVTRELWRHYVHYAIMVLMALLLIVEAIIWFKRLIYKRERKFLLEAFLSNLLLLASAVPDALSMKFSAAHPSLLYCSGMSIAYIIVILSISRYSTYTITRRSITNIIFDNINSGLIVFNPEGRLNIINKYAGEILGLKRVHGETLDALFDISPEKANEVVFKAVAGINRDYRLNVRGIGTSIRLNISAKMDENGEPFCIIGVLTDLTVENRLISEAQAANEAKTNFLSNMSHEIRTPINAVLGMDELILRDSKDPVITEYAKSIDVAGRSLLAIINDVLDFNKIESGAMTLTASVYSIASVISASVNMLIARAEEHSIGISVNCSPDFPSLLKGDDNKVKQIVTNLLSNAVKYTKDGGSVSIDITGKMREDGLINLTISVSDTGIGMTEEGIKTIFNSFERLDLKRNRSIEGSGLGLPIVKSLVDLMEGTIDVKSTYGVGSVFTVTLPQWVNDATPIGDIRKHLDDSTQTTGHKYFKAPDARILIVDDVKLNIDVLLGYLAPTEIKADTALGGEEALSLIKSAHYDIIFMDHMMPGVDGIEAYKRMKADTTHPNQDTPVIMLTANAVSGADLNYISYGFSDYLSKPVKLATLENTVLKYLPANKIFMTEAPVTNKTERLAESENELLNLLSQFLDTDSGMEYAAGSFDFYLSLLKTYVEDDKAQKLQGFYDSADWENYRITAHSIKGTSKTIGANALSDAAKALEMAARDKDLDYIHSHHSSVCTDFKTLSVTIGTVLSGTPGTT